jgi:hypothetical protein
MKTLANREVIEDFVKGYVNGKNHTGSMHIETFSHKIIGDYTNKISKRTVLYSYSTPIAVRGRGNCDELFYFMTDKYFSQTTTVHQNMLIDVIMDRGYYPDVIPNDKFKDYLKENNMPIGKL